MALPNNNITPGRPPLLWSDVYDAFVQVNQNFDSIAATIGGASGPPRTITNITQADPAVVTTSIAHGYLDAQPVTLYTVVGMVEVNGTEYYAKRLSDTTFSLYSDDQLTTSIDSTSFNAYVSGGVVVGSLGIDPIDFTTLDSDIIPTSGNEYELGGPSNSWKNIYLAQTTDAPEDVNNGIWLGTARIQGLGGSADLPANSTVDGSLIIDPDKTFFKEIQVDNESSIIATEFGSSLNITSGTAISVTVDSGAESLVIDNTGVTSLTGSTYIGVDVSTGDVTITNLGVTTVAAGAAVSGRSAGAGISVSGATGNVTITNTGILTVDSGSPGFINVSVDDPTGVATVSFNAGAVTTAAFRYVIVDGDTINLIEADNVADSLNFVSGAGINITKVPGTDTITFNVNTNLDINGSVFSDDSTVIVDATENKIYASGGFFGDVTGNVTGDITGNTTGYHTGDITGSVFADDSTKLVDAVEGLIVGNVDNSTVTTEFVYIKNTEYSLFSDEVGDFYIRGASTDSDIIIRTNASGLGQYDFTFGKDGNLTVEGNITANTIFASTVDTTDSSAITVVPAMTFNSDVTVENELFIGTSRVMAIEELKTIVASSVDFTDFQARIAAL
jgi:hypothetical protein